MDIGDVDAKALKLQIPVNKDFPSRDVIKSTLLKAVPAAKQETLVDFLIRLYSVYVDLHFAYLEINPLVCLDGVDGKAPTIHYLDMAAKLDQVHILIGTPGIISSRFDCDCRPLSQSVDPNGPSLAMSRSLTTPQPPRESRLIAVHRWVRLTAPSMMGAEFDNSLSCLVFPAPFGRDLTKEEAYIQKLDGSTGASLKLTVLNAEGRIWTMVAGGGASVVYR